MPISSSTHESMNKENLTHQDLVSSRLLEDFFNVSHLSKINRSYDSYYLCQVRVQVMSGILKVRLQLGTAYRVLIWYMDVSTVLFLF